MARQREKKRNSRTAKCLFIRIAALAELMVTIQYFTIDTQKSHMYIEMV